MLLFINTLFLFIVLEEQCKKTLTSLRNFKRAVKNKKKTRSGQANVTSKKRKCQDELSFLASFAEERPTLCTITTHEGSTTRDKDHNHNDCDVSLDGRGSIPSVDHPSDEALPDSDALMLDTATAATPMIRLTHSRRMLFEKSTSEGTFSTALMKLILEDKKQPDDIGQFFASMAAIVRSFPSRERVSAKAKVFEVISKMEMDILNDSASSTRSSTFFRSNDSFGQNSFRSTVASVRNDDYQRAAQTPMPEISNDFYF